MKLSIVIPLFNKEKYIERCLESLFAQDLTPNEYEIIVVDDGSKDGGPLIVQTYAERKADTNIVSVRQQNQGPSVARNRGLDEAKGDYVYFLDADDYLAPNVLNGLIELSKKNNLDILEFDTKELEEGALPEHSNYSLEQPYELAIPVLDGISYMADHDFRNQAWRYIVKRSYLLDCGIRFLKDMRAYEDLIFTASVFLGSKRISKVNLDAHRYIKVENSIVTNRDPKKSLEFIQGMVKAVEELHMLIKNLNGQNEKLSGVFNRMKAKQQAVVFALIIRTFKYRLYNWKDLSSILAKMKTLEVYPLSSKIGGNGNRIQQMIFVPIFNSKTCLFLGLRIMKQFPFL